MFDDSELPPKSILHVITTIERGGAENQLLVLAREQVRWGAKVFITFLKGKPELEQEFLAAGVTIYHELSNRHPILQVLILRRLLRNKNYLIHAHLPRSELVVCFAAGKKPFIISRHNAEFFFPSGPRLVSILLSRIVTKRAAKVIAISKAVKDFLLESKEIVNPQNLVVVRYGYTSVGAQRSIKKSRKSGPLHIGTISRLVDQKDLHTLISVLAALTRTIPTLKLSIVGSGPNKDKLMLFAELLGVSSNIDFLGRKEDVFPFLNSLDVFVLTSKYEGFGLVLLEAMDSKVPIVASRNSAILEVLGDNFPGLATTGDVEDFLEKIQIALSPAGRIKFTKIQSHRLPQFSAVKMWSDMLEVYKSL